MRPSSGRNLKGDPTIWAIPGFFATMALEQAWYRKRPARAQEAGAYESRDTRSSLTMGNLSILAPLLLPRLLKPLTPGRGRHGKVLLGLIAGSALATTLADKYLAKDQSQGVLAISQDEMSDGEAVQGKISAVVTSPDRHDASAELLRRIAAPIAVGASGIAAASLLASKTNAEVMYAKRLLPDLGKGPAAFGLAMLGWDFLYYWSHRIQHEYRYLWAVHVVHHSSEHYNLSTALRQPVSESLVPVMPYGILGLLGLRPSLILKARGLNLIWQYWIHTEAVESLGLGEEFLSTPSAHRVHHGSNKKYLDLNHGGILIIWDRIFGTFQREEERPTYGLTKNIKTFNPLRVISHEFQAIFKDVSQASSWRERLGYVAGPPGWKPASKGLTLVAASAASIVDGGGMAERTNALVLKTRVVKATVGSNPTLSAEELS